MQQFAATLPSKPVIKDSLDGGTDYAYGFATTGNGTAEFTFGPSDSLFVNVNNIGQQITDYLATHPKINDKTLFVVWGGAIDVSLCHFDRTRSSRRPSIRQSTSSASSMPEPPSSSSLTSLRLVWFPGSTVSRDVDSGDKSKRAL